MPDISPKKIRYSIVSITATAIDFGLLIILTIFGLSTIKANYISSSAGFVYSFIFNKKYTFKTASRHIKREVIEYVGFTLFGIWAIQPLIIYGVESALQSFTIHGVIVVVIAKLLASLATFIWNYFFYTRVVFRKKK